LLWAQRIMSSLAQEQKNIYSAALYSIILNITLLAVATLMHSGTKHLSHSSAIQIKYLPGLSRSAKTKNSLKRDKTVVKTPKKVISEESISRTSAEPSESENKADALPDIVPLSEVTRFPQFLNRIEPSYPETERSAGREAQVIAEVVIDTRGRIIEVEIIKSAGPEFDRAVLESINKSSFVPGYLEGKPVVVRLQIPFKFRLR